MKLETYKALPINRTPIRLLKRDYLARMDFDLVGFPSGTSVKFKALLPDGQEYEDDDATHFRVLGNQLTYRVPRDLSESSGSLVSAFFVINNVESSRLLVHITEPNDIKSNNYIGQMDRIMNHVLSDAILINEISTNGSGIIDAKTDELVKQVTQWTSDTLAKINKTVGSISDVQKVIDQAIDVDRNNFKIKLDDISKSLDTAESDMSNLSLKIEAAKKDVSQIDFVQIQSDAKTAKDTANLIQTKLGNVPTGSTVMNEINKSQLVTGATVNGKSVPISNRNLQITLPTPDLSGYVQSSTLGSYDKTTDVDTKLKDYAKKGEVDTGGTIASKTPLYRNTNLWVQSKNNWQKPIEMSSGSPSLLDKPFKSSDLKYGIFVGFNKHILTNSSIYPTVDMPFSEGSVIFDDFAKFTEVDFYFFISKNTVEAISLVNDFRIVTQSLGFATLRDKNGVLVGDPAWNGGGSLTLTFGKNDSNQIANVFSQIWLPNLTYSNTTISMMSFPVIDEVIAV